MKQDKMIRKVLQGYEAIIYWDDSDQIYVAEFPAFTAVGAHGETPDEVIYEAEVAIRLQIRSYQQDGMLLPPTLPTINDVIIWSELINKSALARAMGVKEATLKSKIRNKTELSVDEAVAASKALEHVKLQKAD